jgi:putative endonuclease
MTGSRDDPMTARRRKAEKRGHLAETVATLALRLKGYRILARRVRTKAGEIDIVAIRGDIIAFVEVKARGGELVAVDAVTDTAKRRIRAAGDVWIARQESIGRDLAGFSYRYDIVAVSPRRWPRHFPDAF